MNQRGKGESVWYSKRSGSKRAQSSVFRGPRDILYQNENFLARLSPPPLPPIEFSEWKELGNPGDVDPGQSKDKKWRLESCMEQKLHGSRHTQPVAWGRATEAVEHKTLNSLQHHEGAAAVVVICDSVAPFLKMNSHRCKEQTTAQTCRGVGLHMWNNSTWQFLIITLT